MAGPAGIDPGEATLMGAGLTVGAAAIVGSVRLAWRSLSTQIDAWHDDLKGDIVETKAVASENRDRLVSHGERLAYVEGLLKVPRGSLHTSAPEAASGPLASAEGA